MCVDVIEEEDVLCLFVSDPTIYMFKSLCVFDICVVGLCLGGSGCHDGRCGVDGSGGIWMGIVVTE